MLAIVAVWSRPLLYYGAQNARFATPTPDCPVPMTFLASKNSSEAGTLPFNPRISKRAFSGCRPNFHFDRTILKYQCFRNLRECDSLMFWTWLGHGTENACMVLRHESSENGVLRL